MNCPSCGHENIDGIDRCENCLAPFRQLDIPSIEAAESFAQSVMEDDLGQLNYEPPVSVAPGTPAIDVARRMKEANTGCALVVEGGKLVGIFTEHDVFVMILFFRPMNAKREQRFPTSFLLVSYPQVKSPSKSCAPTKCSLLRWKRQQRAGV